MSSRHRKQTRQRALGTILLLFGILLWAIAVTGPLSSLNARFGSHGHIDQLFLGVVAGGAFVEAGIILLATSLETQGPPVTRNRR
jgi:hypothetical protein